MWGRADVHHSLRSAMWVGKDGGLKNVEAIVPEVVGTIASIIFLRLKDGRRKTWLFGIAGCFEGRIRGLAAE